MSFEKLVPLNEFITLQRGFDLPKGDRIDGEIPVVASTGVGGYHNEAKVEAPGVVIGRSGSIGGGQYITEDFWPLNTTLWVKDFKGHYPRYAYYLLRNIDFTNFNVGGAVPTLNRNHLSSVLVADIGYNNEKKIAKILGELDDKIELNRQTNQTLEHIAQAIFKCWFVDFEPTRAKIIVKQKGGNELAQELAAQALICGAITLHKLAELEGGVLGIEKELHTLITKRFPNEGGVDDWQPQQLAAIAALFPNSLVDSELGEVPEGWEVIALDEIAHYQNGLALQKFRPEDEGDFLPVLKIAQLKKGFADGAEKASPNIKPECIVDNGDVVFSWSGSLVVDVWCGGKVALNQHLFKVTSLDYPKWFYCYWTKHHLEVFQQVAADKAVTMGHIKRSHLGEAKCIVPSCDLEQFSLMANLLEKQIDQRLESVSLQEVRDSLLPKFLSGELTTTTTEKANHV